MHKPNTEDIIQCANITEWGFWLRKNSKSANGVWLKIAKKGAKGVSISISDALDVALCYGWIDSHRKSYDASYFLQRYSARRPGSPWSKLNVIRAEALLAAGRMKPAGLREMRSAKQDGRWDVAYEAQRSFQIPDDFAAELAKHKQVDREFRKLTKTTRYSVVLPILRATTLEQRRNRIEQAITSLKTTPPKKILIAKEITQRQINKRERQTMTDRLDNLPILEFESADLLRNWLEIHNATSKGIWLRIYRKSSNIRSVAFEQVLDEGLCFGWSESKRRKYDDVSYIQKFTPRKTIGTQSARNLARVKVLIKQGKMKPSGLVALGQK